METFEKLVLSFLVALLVPWVTALALNLYFQNPLIMLAIGLGLSAWFLIAGLQRNGEKEESVGAIFGTMTEWIIPSGISWWFPKPIGAALRKVSTEKKTLDRSASSGKPFTLVKTRDGGTVDVGVVKTWRIVDTRKAAEFALGEIGKPGDLEKQVESLLDRGVRLFALSFDSDEGVDKTENSALSHQKAAFSNYLCGSKESLIDLNGKDIGTSNDIAEKATALGIEIVGVDVVDVIEPAPVREARNKAAAEKGEAEAEERDVRSIRNRILELMWDTSDPEKIREAKARGEEPLMTELEARRTVRTARKDLVDIHVGGDAGDFAKGAVITERMKGSSK